MTKDSESIDTVLGAIAKAPARSPPLPGFANGARIGGRYVVQRLLGRGGMGSVYQASDEVLGKDIALKLVDGIGNLERLRDEVRLAHEVTHRNVCRTYDLEAIDGRWVVKMELVDGVTLADRVSAGRLPIREVTTIARQIAIWSRVTPRHGTGGRHGIAAGGAETRRSTMLSPTRGAARPRGCAPRSKTGGARSARRSILMIACCSCCASTATCRGLMSPA